MNGYECLTELKKTQEYKHIPVIISTTSKSEQDIERTQKLGASLYTTKPSNFSTLCSSLNKILDLDFSGFEFTV